MSDLMLAPNEEKYGGLTVAHWRWEAFAAVSAQPMMMIKKRKNNLKERTF